VAWPRGEAAACKAVYTGSNPVATSLPGIRADVPIALFTLDPILTFGDDGIVRKKYVVPVVLSVALLLSSCVGDTSRNDEAEEEVVPTVLEEPQAASEASVDEPSDDTPKISLPGDCSGFGEDLRDFTEEAGFDTLEDADDKWSDSGVPEGVGVEELGDYRLCIHGVFQSGYFRLFRFQEASPEQWMSLRDTRYQEGFRDISVNGYDGVYVEYALDPTGENENIIFPTQSPPEFWPFWEFYFYNDGLWLWAQSGEYTFSADDPYAVLLKYLN